MNGPSTMEGYLHKKGHALPIMQRRFCVLKGTMLAYYTNEEEYTRKLTPRNVLEVVGVKDLGENGSGSGFLSPSKKKTHAFEIEYLGGTTYQCNADSREEKLQWLSALQHALDEPNRIIEDEIEDAQRHLQEEAEKEEAAMAKANDAVARAQEYADEAMVLDAAIKANKNERMELEERLRHAQVLLAEARKTSQQTETALDRLRTKAHDAVLTVMEEESKEDGVGEGYESSLVSSRTTAIADQDIATRVAHLAAQLEVDQTQEATQVHEVEVIEDTIRQNEQQLEELNEKAKLCATEGRRHREAAASSLQSAQSAKHLSRLRISSWTASSSHLDPLAEGYLLCKHPVKPSMHRRYYVLYGNTLCWYKDVDDYNQHVEIPSGVVHVSAVTEWTGKVGGMKTFPHAFAVATVEGKTLHCSAPTRQSVVTWETALHIGLTMPALSPHRAMQAKARRDSFDLLSSSTGHRHQAGPMQRRASLAHVAASETPGSRRVNIDYEKAAPNLDHRGNVHTGVQDEVTVLVEGYLVKKSSLFPVMKKIYCVLDRLRLLIYESHEHYATSKANGTLGTHEEVLVCGVSDWDGHGTLLQYHNGFHIHTVKHHMIQCSAANGNEKSKWTTTIHEALLRFKDLLLTPAFREEQNLEQKRAAIRAAISPSDEMRNQPSLAAKFQTKIQQLYMQYHPTKIHDVPMLVAKYIGRESALIAHLDRIYGTALGQDEEVVQLVRALETSEKDVQRGRRRLSSGVDSGLREFGKMTGYLKWIKANKEGPESSLSTKLSFSVLSVDKLLRYSSETAFATEPYNPLEVVQVLSVRESTTSSCATFTITYRHVEIENIATSQTSTSTSSKDSWVLELEASSEELRTLWVAKIRGGIGIAAASKTQLDAEEEANSRRVGDKEAFRRKLIEYYRQNNPRRIAEVDTLLHYFDGRERLLLVDLDATYGTCISTDEEYVKLLPGAAQPGPSLIRSNNGDVVHCESYLWVKHPQLGSGFQKFYCVLRNTKLSCFENSRDAHADFLQTNETTSTSPRATKPALLSDTVVNLNYMNSKLHEMRVFSIEGKICGTILLRADVEPLFQDWTRKLRKASDHYQELELSNHKAQMPPWWNQLHDKLVNFYQIHQPAKTHEVSSLLRSFEGRERELLLELDRIHHTQIANDVEYVSLLPEVDSNEDDSDSDLLPTSPVHDEILMEGYLVKRGHLVPSMRKRYCVLIKNILTYFLTHEDSRNPDVQPQGSFRVEIISDWHGKTATQNYEHGMELETHDGKTFFCAAFSSEEKTQWMRAFHHGIAATRLDSVIGSDTTGSNKAAEESEEDHAKRDQFRERLVTYYQQHNPRKIVDLDLLLACYKGRELVMLEAMDATYGSQLLQDETLLRLLPPLNAHTQALRRLEYDGPLERAAGGNTEAAWKHAQKVYVSQKNLTLSFYASREGFKAGAGALSSAADRAVTVLAVKAVDNTRCFAVETTDHVWIYFKAPNVLEKAHWLQLLQGALDAILAKTILDEERHFLENNKVGADKSAGKWHMKGFLMVRMDFFQSLADFQQQIQGAANFARASISPTATPVMNESTNIQMKECYVVLQHNNELCLFAEDDRNQLTAKLTALSTRAWKAIGGVAPTSSDSSNVGRFPFQILTQEQVILSCGAATDLDRAKWIRQIRRGSQHVAAAELLKEQVRDVDEKSDVEDRPVRRASVIDESTGDVRGYLFYHLKEEKCTEQEGFVVVTTRSDIEIFADETSLLIKDRPRLKARVIDIAQDLAESDQVVSPVGHLSKILKGWGSSPRAYTRFAFSVQVIIEGDREERSITFFPASAEERNLWVNTIVAGINTSKGEQLLKDEKVVLTIESGLSSPIDIIAVEETFVWSTSAMEGELTPWRSSGSVAANCPVFAVLCGCELRIFDSRQHAFQNAQTQGGQDSPATVHATVAGISEWTPATNGTEVETNTGFQLQASKQGTKLLSLYFTASTSSAKQQWVHAIQHELDFALAEQYLDEDAKEFARMAASHVAAASGGSVSTCAEPGVGTVITRREGYVRVRHQFVGSMWRERYAVIAGTALWIFKDGGDACADDWQRKAVEHHELISAQEWQGTTATTGNRDNQYRHGVRLENQDGAILELAFATKGDRDSWYSCVLNSLRNEAPAQVEGDSTASSKYIIRDAALPFVPGAAMEGYLKVRDRRRSGIFSLPTFGAKWRTRYAVLIGTQWLLYETQQQALALHGHNHQVDACEQKEEGDDVLPQAVLEVMLAEAWQPSARNKKRGGEEDLETHGFVIVANKTSTYGGFAVSPSKESTPVGDVMECKAQTSLERKRWLNAIEDQISNAHKEQDMVRNAMEQHKHKQSAQQNVKEKFQAIREDANRQSVFLKDVLESLAVEDTTSEEEESTDEEAFSGEDETELPMLIRTRSMGRVHSPENSPMYRLNCGEGEGRRGSHGGVFFGDSFPYDALGSPSKASRKTTPWYSWQSIFTCCFDKGPTPSTASAAAIIPLKNPRYEYVSFHEDKPSSLEDF